MKKFWVAFYLSLALFFHCLSAVDPLAVYLTMQNPPDKAMTVQWIVPITAQEGDLHYKAADDSECGHVKAPFLPLPNHFGYGVHRFELVDLKPNTEYRFRLGIEPKEYSFLTLPPTLETPLRFVVGGDMYQENIQNLKETCIQAASKSPHFAIIGGDIAYAANKFFLYWENGQRWLDFLSGWSETMVTPAGHLIPTVAVVGNHDVTGRYGQTPSAAPFFYAFFPFPGYQVLDIGNYLSLFLLDSGHTHPVGGEQAHWLYHSLEARKDKAHKFAVYHVPAYPSVRNFKNARSQAVRNTWVPLFDYFGLHAAFEHHDHSYKRTFPITGGEKRRHGVVYIGDGAWGVDKPRKARMFLNTWFLAKTKNIRHFILVTLDKESRRFQAVSHKGAIFDDYTN